MGCVHRHHQSMNNLGAVVWLRRENPVAPQSEAGSGPLAGASPDLVRSSRTGIDSAGVVPVRDRYAWDQRGIGERAR